MSRPTAERGLFALLLVCLSSGAARAVTPTSLQAGCRAERRTCSAHVDSFVIPIAPGEVLERFEIQLNGATVYDFATDVSNPPLGPDYAPGLPGAGFAARCGEIYVASLLAQDTGDGSLQAIGESAPFPCPMPTACAPAPAEGCIGVAKARLNVNEARSGKEKLAASFAALDEATEQAALGDPVAGDTLYDLCIYTGLGALAGSLSVERAGDSCGAAQTPCWSTRARGGLSYKDLDRRADGVVKMKLVPGPGGRGKLALRAGNQAAKGRNALPRGIAASLAGQTSATMQLLARGAECFSAELGTVKKADGSKFKARAP